MGRKLILLPNWQITLEAWPLIEHTLLDEGCTLSLRDGMFSYGYARYSLVLEN